MVAVGAQVAQHPSRAGVLIATSNVSADPPSNIAGIEIPSSNPVFLASWAGKMFYGAHPHDRGPYVIADDEPKTAAGVIPIRHDFFTSA